MVLKILYKSKLTAGYTILELLVVIAALSVVMAGLLVVLNPIEQFKKGRDNKRINDLSLLERAISEYKVDKGVFPDTVNTLRQSTILPSGSTSLPSVKSGWIKQDLTGYAPRLPLDPINDVTYNYKYLHDDETFELDAKLEIYTDHESTDGGNDSSMYEVGNNLSLISP